MTRKMTGNEKFIAGVRRLRDPIQVLEATLEGWQEYGGDPYYRDLAGPVQEHAEEYIKRSHKGPFRAMKCTCGHPACKNWMVSPVAAVQGVGFTKRQAEAVAKVLNAMER